MHTAIRNGAVLTPAGLLAADVGVEGERIVSLGRELHGEEEIDASGCYVLPGAIDPHVHLQMPLREYTSADDFLSGTVAAACGGTTTVIDFVEPKPGEALLAALANRRAEADGRVAVDYGLHMTIPAWHAAHPEILDAIPELVASGVTSFKIYLAYEGLRLNDEQVYLVLKRIARAGGLPIVHCENGPICDALRAEAVSSGRTASIYHADTRPARQEAEATGRLIDLAALAGCPAYIVHVSCDESLARIQGARARGEAIYGETCPQYLLLDRAALEAEHGERLICAPPLRSGADRDALWRGLVVGDLDVLATDHCPFTAEEKSGHPDFTTVPGGLPSIEARLSLARTFGRRYGLTMRRWVDVCAANPARIFGLAHKGRIEPGCDADIVVFDPRRCATIRTGQTLHERVDWSPYEGIQVEGWPRVVLSRGRVVVRDGQFVGEVGWGRFLARGLPNVAPPA